MPRSSPSSRRSRKAADPADLWAIRCHSSQHRWLRDYGATACRHRTEALHRSRLLPPRVRAQDSLRCRHDNARRTRGIVEPFVAAFPQRTPARATPRTPDELCVPRGGAADDPWPRPVQDQLRRRYDLPLPVESVTTITRSIHEANRLVKAALRRIERLQLRDGKLTQTNARRHSLRSGRCRRELRSSAVPTFTYTRLDTRYRPVSS